MIWKIELKKFIRTQFSQEEGTYGRVNDMKDKMRSNRNEREPIFI